MSRVQRSMRARRSSALTRAAVAIESLEMRRLLSCDIDVYGDTLVIKGDRDANEITVTEVQGVVVVTCDDEGPETISGGASIDEIIIKAGKGNDVIEVNLEDEDGDLERVLIDGSDGHDEISLTIGNQLLAAEVTASHNSGGGGEWSGGGGGGGGGGEDDLEVDITGGSGNDTIDVTISLFRGGEENGLPEPVVTTSGSSGGSDEDHDEDLRGLELDIDAGSGHDTVDVELLVVNFDENNFPDRITPTSGGRGSSYGRSGADGGDGDGNIDIEIDGGSGNDDINLDLLVLNFAGGIATFSASGSYGGGGSSNHNSRGGNEEELEIDINGGSGNDDINVDIEIFNLGILLPITPSGFNGDGYGSNINDVDLDLDIDGGSGNDTITVNVETTPFFGEYPNGTGEGGGLQFSDIEMTIDGESGEDVIDVTVRYVNNGIEVLGVPLPTKGPNAPVNIDLEGGSGNDDLRLQINSNGANLIDSNANYSGKYDNNTPTSSGSSRYGGSSRYSKREPFIRLEGESGNDDLTLLIFNATIWDYYGKPYLLNGGSGFDTCTTNVDEDQVKIISCEDHNEPQPI